MTPWHKWERERAETHRRLGYLDEQLKLIAAIDRLVSLPWVADGVYERCQPLAVELSRVMMQNMERIWLLSGGELPDDRPAPTAAGEVEPDDLPF